MYIAINNCERQGALTNKWHLQLAVLVACSDFTINKHRWLWLTVKQVLVVLIVSTDACTQGVSGSNPAYDYMVVKIFLLWNLCWSVRAAYTFFTVFIVNSLDSTHKSYSLHKTSNLKANFAFTGVLKNNNSFMLLPLTSIAELLY